MDKKKTAIRAGAVLVVALAAGQLVQTMSADRATAEASRPKAVQTVSAGAEAASPAIPAAASLSAPAASVAAVVPEVVAPAVGMTDPVAAPKVAEETLVPAALPDAPDSSLTTAEPLLPEMAPADEAAGDVRAQPGPAVAEPDAPETAEAACSADMVLTAGPQAMISVSIFAPCRAGERVVLRHGGLAVAETLAADGSLQMDFPALNARGELSALFPDAEVLRGSVAIPDAAKTNRFAVQWMGDDAFQLHAFENGADYGQAGDVNADAPVSPNGGYLVALGNPMLDFPMMAQVYTQPSEGAVAVDVVIEAAVTEATCGRELLGEVVQAKDGAGSVNDLTLAMPDCDAVGDILVLNNPGQDVTLAAAN